MERLCLKSARLTGYLQDWLDAIGDARIEVVTPRDPAARGCQLSLVVPVKGREVYDALSKAGVICDWREPDVIRVAPVPLYNTFEEVYQFYEVLQKVL